MIQLLSISIGFYDTYGIAILTWHKKFKERSLFSILWKPKGYLLISIAYTRKMIKL